jgi:hypothetical protein
MIIIYRREGEIHIIGIRSLSFVKMHKNLKLPAVVSKTEYKTTHHSVGRTKSVYS